MRLLGVIDFGAGQINHGRWKINHQSFACRRSSYLAAGIEIRSQPLNATSGGAPGTSADERETFSMTPFCEWKTATAERGNFFSTASSPVTRKLSTNSPSTFARTHQAGCRT